MKIDSERSVTPVPAFGTVTSTSESNANQSGNLPMPKHIAFPEIPNSSEVLNELVMFIFILFAAGMQFVNIYRTIWWLPDSFINHTVNLYLIEPYLIVFIIVMTSRRLGYSLLMRFLDILYGDKQFKAPKIIAKIVFSAILILSLGLCITKIFAKQNYLLSFFLLVYPLVVYLLIFGFQIEPFLRTTCEVEGFYFNGMPMHSCSSSPTTIRDEVEVLKNDFNNRFKQVIFTSVVNAYYAGFVPCFFAQNYINYNVLWATQHIIFIWLGGFTMCIAFCFPAKYSDILHRAALHLGLWLRVDGRTNNNSNTPPSMWSKSVVWSNACVVRHTGDLYKSSGAVTVALPGNTSHSRFFKLFNNPSIIYMILTIVQTIIVFMQILLLWFAIEWHFILSISFLAFTNHYTLFKIIRDYFITKKVYTAETSISEKINSPHYN